MKTKQMEELDKTKFYIKNINGGFYIGHPDHESVYINKRNKIRRFATPLAALNLLKTRGVEYAKVYT